jgi:hypothetical protein
MHGGFLMRYYDTKQLFTIHPKKIVVYDFAHDDDISIYSFEDKVPVHIWDGQCEIDFAEICEEIRDMYDES